MLYELIENEQVLNRVIGVVSKTKKSLLVVHSEFDESSVQPNQAYETVLKNLVEKDVKITRFFYGSKEVFERHCQMHLGIKYVLQPEEKFYQRAIIIDDKKAFFKIGNQFCYTEHKPLVDVLKNFLRE